MTNKEDILKECDEEWVRTGVYGSPNKEKIKQWLSQKIDEIVKGKDRVTKENGKEYEKLKKLLQEKDKECKWEYEEDMNGQEQWNTDCGQCQVFIDGDIKENEYNYCPYCGKKIKQIKGG